MAINSRQKGAKGERELSKVLHGYGYNCRRGQQYCGDNGDADVVGLPGIHVECKRVERLNLYDAVDQAKHDAKPDELPAVFHRKNHCEWLVTIANRIRFLLMPSFSFIGSSRSTISVHG